MKINKESAELIGALAGDGNIYRKNNKYRMGFTGNKITDKDYFEYLKILIRKEWKKEAKIVSRERGIRIVINSKKICLYLTDELKIPFGLNKSLNITIPKPIKCDWNLAKYFIRGIMDTDGTVFAVRKPRIRKYPSIELTTISKKLIEEVKSILESKGFRVSNIWHFVSKPAYTQTYRFGINGRDNLRKWMKEIGFSNSYKRDRALSYLD